MSWFVLGSLLGFWAAAVQRALRAPAAWPLGYLGLGTILLVWIPAVVGMVIVRREIGEYGIYARFDLD